MSANCGNLLVGVPFMGAGGFEPPFAENRGGKR